MALQSKTFSSSAVLGYRINLTITENSVDVNTNRSNISYRLYMTSGSWNYRDYHVGWTINIDGTVVSSKSQSASDQLVLPVNSSVTIVSGTTNITHTDDGTKTMSISVSTAMKKTDHTPGSQSISGSMTLTPIARASTLDYGAFTIGTAGNISITRLGDIAKDTITYSLLGSTGTIATQTTSSTVQWTPPNSFYALMANTASAKGVISVTSFDSSGTQRGTRNFEFNVNVPSDVKPTVTGATITPVNDNEWIASKNIFVAGYSRASVALTATAGQGSTISKWNVTGDFGTASAATFTSEIIQTSGSKTLTAVATDARGRNSANFTSSAISVFAYSRPGVSQYDYQRGTYAGGVWTPSITGHDIKITLTIALSLTGNSANISVKLDGTTVASATEQTAGDKSYYVTNVSPDVSHTLDVIVTDSVGNSVSQSLDITTQKVAFNIDVVNKSVRIGGIAQGEERFECDFDSHFNDDVYVATGKILHAQAATQSIAGLMTTTDKAKLDSLGMSACRLSGSNAIGTSSSTKAADSWQTVTFDATAEGIFNSNPDIFELNPATGSIKVKKAGYYLLYGVVRVHVGASASGTYGGIRILSNGTSLNTQYEPTYDTGGGVGWGYPDQSRLAHLNADDILTLQATAGQAWYSPTDCRMEIVCMQGASDAEYEEMTFQDIDDLWESIGRVT